MQHSPTPWTCDDSEILDANGVEVADTWWGDTGRERRVADAAFIARACNAHDELVSALQDFRDDLFNLKNSDDLQHIRNWLGLAEGRFSAVLAKAEGK